LEQSEIWTVPKLISPSFITLQPVTWACARYTISGLKIRIFHVSDVTGPNDTSFIRKPFTVTRSLGCDRTRLQHAGSSALAVGCPSDGGGADDAT
jgi:hypothetical protein